MDAANDATCRYRITVSGDLGEILTSYLAQESGSVELLRSESVLVVRLQDPRALGRVLDVLYSLRLPLMSVELLGSEGRPSSRMPCEDRA